MRLRPKRGDSPDGLRRRWVTSLILRAVVLLITAALAAVPIIVLVETVVGAPLSSPVPTAPISRSQKQAPASINCSPYERGVVVEIHQIDVDAGSMTADVWMCLGTNQATEFQRPGEQVGPEPPSLSIAGQASNLSVSLARLGRTEDETKQSQGFVDTTMSPVGEVALPLQGSSRDYPLDRYTAVITISETGFCDVGIPTTYLVTDPGVSNFNWVAGVPPPGEMPPAASETETVSPSGKKLLQAECGGVVDTLTLHASRPASTKLFVLCLVLVPLLLLSLLGIRLTEGAPRSIDGLVGVGAIMLAILPIRSVLVPADISSLTLVDFTLASEMTLLAVGTVAWFIWPRRGGGSG